jgi:hypothetical protein
MSTDWKNTKELLWDRPSIKIGDLFWGLPSTQMWITIRDSVSEQTWRRVELHLWINLDETSGN